MLLASSIARSFAHRHDDIPAFHAGYLVATFLAAAMFNIGFFLALILIHVALDYVKYRDLHRFSFAETLRAAFLESLLDITLLALSIVLIFYVHRSFGLPLLSGLLRSGVTVALGLAVLVPKLTVLQHIESVAVHLHTHIYGDGVSAHAVLTSAQKVAFVVLLVALLAIILIPLQYAGQTGELTWLLRKQLIPWKL